VIVLGVDPGLAATGYGVVRRDGRHVLWQDHGCIRTLASAQTSTRLRCIYDGICDVIRSREPDLVVLEEAFAKDVVPKAAISIGQVIGVLLLASSQHNCEVRFVAARSVKQAITGSGSAEKSQLCRSLQRMLGLKDEVRPDHAADALGLAYVGALRWKD